MKDNSSAVIIWTLIVLLVVGGLIFLTTNNNNRNSVDINVDDPNGINSPLNTNPSSPIAETKGVNFVSQSTAVLNGEVNPNGVQTSYWYEYGLTESLGSITSRQLIGAGLIKYSAPTGVTGLKANTTYYYRLSAENQYGRVNGAISSFTTSNIPPIAFVSPNAETRVATDIAKNSATLNGASNPRGVATSYWFEYGATPALGNTTSTTLAGSGNASISLSKQISGLTAGTTYYFRMNTYNGYGIANGRILGFTTTPNTPSAPPEGEAPEANTDDASNITQTGATLRGQVDPNGTETTYYFEFGKSTAFGLFNLEGRTTAKSTGSGNVAVQVSTPLATLDADSTYYYRLVAENRFGKSFGAIYSLTTND